MLMVHCGIIGPGHIWKNTHRAILADLHEKAHIVAVAARSERNQKNAREAYPDATVYSDAGKLLNDPEVEAVIILTPISLNAPMAKAALATGRHAIVEKPVAVSTDEARDLFSVEADSPGSLYILEQHVYKSIIPDVRALIDEGEIGEPVGFERALHVRIAEDKDLTGGYGSTEWRIDPDFPLGNFFDGGIHEVALMQELFGPARAVFARGRSLRPEFGAVDQLAMVIEYPRGVQGTFSHSSSLGKQGDSFVIHGTKAALVVRDREIHLRDPEDGTETLVPLQWHDESTTMWDEILTALPSGKRTRYTPEKALADLSFMEAVTRSLSSAQWEYVAHG